MPEKLITLTFGYNFNQKIGPNILPKNLTTLNFGYNFNQKIEPNTLPENLMTLIFKWISKEKINREHINMINSISNYYNVRLFVRYNILDIVGPKWPIHAANYNEKKWAPEIYDVIDKYTHPSEGEIIVLINKETYQPYSRDKSALK